LGKGRVLLMSLSSLVMKSRRSSRRFQTKRPLSTKEGWENMISYIRVECEATSRSFIEYRTKGPGKTSTEARIEQEAAAGFQAQMAQHEPLFLQGGQALSPMKSRRIS
jgi:hypothetical protein